MNVNNIINYIKQGVTIKTSNGHILFSLGISIITIIGLIVGAITGPVSLHIAYVMLAIHMLSTVVSIALSSDFSFTRNLISLTINFVNLMVQMTLLLTMAYILVFGGNIFVIFIYLSIVLIPVIIGLYNSKRLKSGLYPNSIKKVKMSH